MLRFACKASSCQFKSTHFCIYCVKYYIIQVLHLLSLQTFFVRVEWLVVEYERLWILQAKFLLVKTRGVCEVNTIAPHFVRQVRSVFHFGYAFCTVLFIQIFAKVIFLHLLSLQTFFVLVKKG